MTDQQLIAQAANGNLGPLKAELAKRKPPMGVKSDDLGGGAFGDYNTPDDNLWMEITVAKMSGELTDAQYEELYDAAFGESANDGDTD